MQPTNVLALAKGTERYVFLYDDASHDVLLRTFGLMAVDKDLSFGWYDAAVLSQRARQLKQVSNANPND